MKAFDWTDQAPEELSERYSRAHLDLMLQNLNRLPWAYVPIELSLIWLFARADLLWAGLSAVSCVVIAQIFRYRYIVKVVRGRPQVPANDHLSVLTTYMVVLALLRVSILPVFFFERPISDEHYLVTLVYMGLVGGSVAPAAGVVMTFLAWCLIGGGGLVLCWVLQFTANGALFGVLLSSMIWLLSVYVSDQGKSLRELVRLSYENEALAKSLRIERDRSRGANESKMRFFAAANHDLRQPLHALSLHVASMHLLSERSGDVQVAKVTRGMRNALGQSQALLESLLEVAELDSRLAPPRWTELNLGEFLEELSLTYAPMAREQGVSYRLSKTETPVIVTTDPYLLERLIGNLISNAIKFTPIGSVTVQLETVEGQQEVSVVVADTGPGIPKEEQERIFEEFYQLGNRGRERQRGLGLGLSIVRRIADLLGVHLVLQSELGLGTRVELRLPGAAKSGSTLPRQEEATTNGVNPEESAEIVVLVIDNEPDVLSATGQLLDLAGCQAKCVRNGREAMAALEEGLVPALVLVDRRLEFEDGAEVARALKEKLPAGTVFYIVSGDGRFDGQAENQRCEFEQLTKPVSYDRLRQVFEKIRAERRTDYRVIPS